MDFQQYNRPPPPPQQQPPLPPPPVPPPGSWYSSNQFHYQPPPPPPLPQQSPPPPQAQQWAPPPPHPAPFTGPPYHIQQQAHYPPPPLPPHPHSFPHANQDWGNMNWGHHQSWGNSVAPGNEDWAAKARAWAASKVATDHQHQHPQFTHDSRPEERSHVYEQYTQSADQHFQESMSPVGPTQRALFGHSQEPGFFSSGQSPYVLPYTARDGDSAAASFAQQGNSSISPLVHQQEVPSSYSSIAGKEEATNQNEAFYGSSPLPVNSTQQHHAQLMPMAPSKPADHHYVTDPDPSDQPLDFAPRFNHEPYYACADSGGSVGGADPVSSMPSNYPWPPSAASGAPYSLPPAPPIGSQVEAPVPEHAAQLFGRVQSSSFHSAVPSVGAHFGAGASLHPPAAFTADAYGISDRPKKAAVPNWLREEIIKKKAVITTSAPDLPKEDTRSTEDEGFDKNYRKGDQADSKSLDSSRSTEEEDDDETEVEAARTAAMNQEIKRVLTEVLLKVTDELFDEIATRVLSEDDLTVNVEQQAGPSTQKVSVSEAVTTPRASAKVLIPPKLNDEKSSSSSPGDLLGLANYASDDEDDNEIQSSHKQNPNALRNGRSHEESKDGDRSTVKLEKNARKMSPNVVDSSFKTELRVPEDKMIGEKDVMKIEKPSETPDLKNTKVDCSRSEDKRDKSNKSGKSEVRDTEKEEGNHGKHEERHVKKEKVDDVDGSKDRVKERSHKLGEKEKGKESDSRKRSSPSHVKEERKGTERDGRASVISDNGRKREKVRDEKREKEKSGRKDERSSSRHKSHRSSSIDSRGRERKDNSGRAKDSTGESSDDSRRKLRVARHRSPSPVRSRKRHVSRSPHSKHSQRRHSPYPASESIRGKKSRSRSRSRSRSPLRRKR